MDIILKIIHGAKELSKTAIFIIVFAFLYVPYSMVTAKTYSIKQTCVHTYEVDLQREITDDLSTYKELNTFLANLTEKDTVIFKIYGYGGSVSSASLIINGMKTTKAHTVADVVGASYSAHAFITCAAKEVKMSPASYIMFHSVQSQGPVSRELQEAAAGRMMEDCIAKGFMTNSDKEAMVADPSAEVFYWEGKKVEPPKPLV